MTNSNVVPVTQDEAVKTNIGYSVKIGKQVMKSKLQAAMNETKTLYDKKNEYYKICASHFIDSFHKEATRQIKLDLNNDRDATRFRNLFAKFSRFHEKDNDNGFRAFTTNWDMVQETDIVSVVDKILHGNNKHALKLKEDFLLNEPVPITVDLKIPDRIHKDELDHNYIDADSIPKLGYEVSLTFGEDIKEIFHTARDAQKESRALNKKYNELETKLKNIDEVTEEMEAKLLVNELQKSDTGKEALNVASELITEMLGDTPDLLKLENK